MKKYPCTTCRFRAKYDAAPTSLLGRIWRWHAGWCPGFNGYLKSLPESEREELLALYKLKGR
ncbi:hypothetical protein [Desulfopila sp. IMCC35008]|uniref:hypothetical protein n=1 Tax=Desulfopila sp. IMCC35008 TaxID=2653858 RepID=UPI0013D18BC0|nr:hypothetical protein [Desulfopila sp. IMCC35008]